MTLSKSQYIRALQCYKSIWLYKKKPELRASPDATQESLFNSGYVVGDYAKKYFSGGVEIEFDNDNFNGMIEQTKTLIENKTPVIYEATFKEKNIFAMADILVLKPNGLYDIYEVKSSTGVKDHYINDAAIQYYALSAAVNIGKVHIAHINNQYVRNGDIDVNELFKIEDITDEVLKRQAFIEPNLEAIENVLNGEEPIIDIGPHCDSPYSCDFGEHCWKHIPERSIFNLYWMGGEKKFEMYYKGIVNFDDIPQDFSLSPTQKLQVSSIKTQEVYIDKEVIKGFIDTVNFPINYFDFETFQNAVPRFNNQRAYQQMPFQYSLHIQNERFGELTHKEFLGDENADPREALILQMLKDITPNGSIMAYNQSFEISRIKELADAYPKYQDELLALIPRFVDLIVPFRGRGYYHPDFNGSFSIKSVLPAMFKDNAELSYKALNIQNGGDASDTYANLHLLKDKSQREQIRKDLLAYCRLDTLAMVRIFEKLCEICKD